MVTRKFVLHTVVILSVVCSVANILVVSPGVQYVYEIESVVSGVPKFSYFTPIFCSVLMAAAGIVGWCGSIDDDKICISLYIVATLLLLWTELYIAFAYYGPSNSNGQVVKTKEEIKTAWKNFEDNEKIKKNFRHLEQNWECCGLKSKEDYNRTDLPTSCCNDVRCTLSNSYPRGCLETYSNALLFWLKSSFASIFVSCCVQAVASVVSIVTLFPRLLTIFRSADDETEEPTTQPIAAAAARPTMTRRTIQRHLFR